MEEEEAKPSSDPASVSAQLSMRRWVIVLNTHADPGEPAADALRPRPNARARRRGREWMSGKGEWGSGEFSLEFRLLSGFGEIR